MKKMYSMLLLLVALSMQAQNSMDPVALIGQNITTDSVQLFLKQYALEAAIPGRYTNPNSGIELKSLHDTVISIDFYRNNAVLGKYTGPLHKSITWGMSSGDLYKLLGKPFISYTNSGYSEYKLVGLVLTVWFENKELTQVSLSKE